MSFRLARSRNTTGPFDDTIFDGVGGLAKEHPFGKPCEFLKIRKTASGMRSKSGSAVTICLSEDMTTVLP
ncbi:hypothetical protein [Roseimaritima ulvae]|uniref:hypothetical protein n=1 Tax=Roseimaritima ulvae TaxID=980254 RepID=UPI0011CDCD79|nr:hypothetical protein [Roseimaritima ulvae]